MTLNVNKIQMVFYYKEGTVFRGFEFTRCIYDELKDVFKNTEPQTISVPPNSPIELPRCIWNDANTKLWFSMQSISLSVDLPSHVKWDEAVIGLGEKLVNALSNARINVDRIGVVIEASVDGDLHKYLNDSISIDGFVKAKEANISWLDEESIFNVWINCAIDDDHDIQKIIYDINSKYEHKLSAGDTELKGHIANCVNILNRRINDVIK